ASAATAGETVSNNAAAAIFAMVLLGIPLPSLFRSTRLRVGWARRRAQSIRVGKIGQAPRPRGETVQADFAHPAHLFSASCPAKAGHPRLPWRKGVDGRGRSGRAGTRSW